jgi:Holliday junction resolvase RusA-like endonuclease
MDADAREGRPQAMILTFHVSGIPAPGGSKTAMPIYRRDGSLVIKQTPTGKQRPVFNMVDAADSGGRKGHRQWKDAVGWHGKAAMKRRGEAPLRGPLKLSIVFVMPRPKSVTRQHHTIKPDLTKLLRSTEDALTGIVWADDSQIVQFGNMEKRYAATGEDSGASIVVESLLEPEALLL